MYSAYTKVHTQYRPCPRVQVKHILLRLDESYPGIMPTSKLFMLISIIVLNAHIFACAQGPSTPTPAMNKEHNRARRREARHTTALPPPTPLPRAQ